MNPNSSPFEEEKESWLSLSPPTSHPQLPQPQVQPNQQQQQQQQLEEPPQPKRHKLNPFTFQYIQPKELEPSQQQIEPNTQSLQETHFVMPPNHSTPLIYQEPLPPSEFPSQEHKHQDQETSLNRPIHAQRQALPTKKLGKTETIDPPYQWATSTRATIHSLDYLLSHNITSISGAVKCKGCKEKYDIQFDLKEKFSEVALYIVEQRDNMYDRAPEPWNKPVLPKCDRCGKENSLDHVISSKKRSINWLFLLLGQMIGCCKLDQLKYFCKHTKNHRTGAKDRLVYLTYLGLCKQLSPNGPFDP